ncbi:MAG: hypothetical protein PHU94_05005 [Bacilli bacterium]|nr:hypothetical protein [Bacilli bacterium]MDD4407212.1 hypothetical protein [Bacilli bacterium]
MTYGEIEQELRNLEINSFSSALKGNLLTRLKLEEFGNVESNKIDFKADLNIDNAIYYIDKQINQVMEIYQDRYINIIDVKKDKKKSCGEKCL